MQAALVDYMYQEGTKFADIRVILSRSAEGSGFKDVACINLNDTFDRVELLGEKLEPQEILDLLKDPHCP